MSPGKKSTPEGGVRLPPKLSSIPTFVPRDQLGNSEDLVWSPTSGTREKRPEERYQSPAKHAKTDSRIFGQEIQPNPSTMPKVPKPHPVLSSVIGETSKKGHNRTSSTDSVFVETEPYQSMPSPLGPKTNRLDFGWPKPDTPPKHRVRSGQKLELDREPGILDPQAALMYQNEAIWQTMSETAMTSEQYWQPQPSDISGPRYPSNRAHGVFGAEPFSAPPNIPAFDQMHISGQEPYGGSSSSSFMPQPSQDPYEQSRIPYSQPQPSRRNRTGARNPSIQHQLGEPSLESPPFQQQYDQMPPRGPRRNPYKHSQSPSFVPHHEVWSPNHPPPMTRLQQALYHSDPSIGTPDPNSESLVVPLPGSMPAIDYWNMLHQRETDIQTRLANANVPMTVLQQDYISRLGNARIAAVTSRLPLRGNKSSQLWLQILQKELNGIWEQRPGDQPQTAVVMDRKADYEKAVLREIEVALLETPQEGQET